MVRKRLATGRTRLPYTVYDAFYTNRCFVDPNIIDENRAGVMRATFMNNKGEVVVVHVATTQFFALHHLREEDMVIWESMNLNGFFGLQPRGPYYMRAFQALSTLTPTNDLTVIDLQGSQRQFHLSIDLIYHALGLAIGESLTTTRRNIRMQRMTYAPRSQGQHGMTSTARGSNSHYSSTCSIFI